MGHFKLLTGCYKSLFCGCSLKFFSHLRGRAVTKGQGPGIFPSYYKSVPPATLIQNENIGKRKMHQITKL